MFKMRIEKSYDFISPLILDFQDIQDYWTIQLLVEAPLLPPINNTKTVLTIHGLYS